MKRLACALVMVLLAAGCAETAQAPPITTSTSPDPTPTAAEVAETGDWWHGRVFYEVFVRSFQDSNGDGIGDLQGLIDRLDYLNDGDPTTTDDLGVTGVWLMPVAESPSYHGYDVVDYRSIEADYGSVDDMKALVDEARRRGIEVIVDLVVNHSSVDHPWFIESAAGVDRTDWYVWEPTDPGYMGPWGQDPWHRRDGRYYYGVFWEGMPDLNLENPEVTDELVDVARWWLEEIGVAGFRIDAAKHLIEDGEVQENTPATIAWLEDFRRRVAAIDPDAFVVGEVWDDVETVKRYVPGGLDMAFDFELATAIVQAVSAQSARRLAAAIEDSSAFDGTTATFLTNHDMDRVMSVVSTKEKARVAAALLMTLPGVPFVYYGEEIGLTGSKPDERIRTPMVWDDSDHGGFSAREPWQPPQIGITSVEEQLADPESLLAWYRGLIALRSSSEALSTGTVEVIDTDLPQVIAYTRSSPDTAVIVVANLSRRRVEIAGLNAGVSNEVRPLFGDAGLAWDGDEGLVGEMGPYSVAVLEVP